MTFGGWIILLLIFTIHFFYQNKKNFYFFYQLTLFLFFFLITIFPWAILSYNYFGKILFNHLSYYPYVRDWSSLMYDIGLPNINNFWQNLDLLNYTKNHLIWGLKNLYLLHLVTFPTFVFYLSFLLIPISVMGALKLNSKGFILFSFTILYFFGLLFGSYATQGNLYPRHFMALLASISILLGYGLIITSKYLREIKFFKKICSFLINYKYLLYIVPILITTLGIQYKKSFWERDSTYFFEFGKKIKNITNIDDVIVYAYTPQDAWCVTNRKIIHDIAFKSPRTMGRLSQEIIKYKAKYLLVDLSNYIYVRDKNLDKNINQVINEYYANLKLEEVLIDASNGYYFYKILS